MTIPAPCEFDDAHYTAFRKRLLRHKGSSAQRRFLKQVKNRDDFIRELEKLKVVGAESADVIPTPLTESEFKDPPTDTEQTLYQSWRDLVPAVACRSSFWARLTLQHIREGRIEPVYLAANGGSLPGGEERIDRALADTTAQQNQLVDRCVRTVLRRLGGLPEVRGNRSVFVDCPFARAWWREHMVSESARGDPKLEKYARTVFRINQTYWEKFIDRVVFRNSTFGAVNIRGAFVRALGAALSSDSGSGLHEPSKLQRLCRRVTAYQGRRELGILSDAALDALMQTLVRSV